MSSKNGELPGVTGKGVERLEIKEVEVAISRYEKKKAARCKESPGEIEAKQALQEVLHKHREELPKDEHGQPYYRTEIDGVNVDFLLEEKLKRKKVSTDETGEEF